MWKAEWESDPRDFLVENILWTPTEQDLKDLPKSINLLSELPRTYDQRNVWACTAFWLTHVQLLQNVKDFETNLVELDPWSLWKNMWHNPDDPRDGWDYLENALKFSREKGINWTKPDGKPHVFLTEGYAYWQFWDLQAKDFDTIKYYLSKWMPVYTAMKGNSKTWREMVAWEVTTLFTVGESTGWHAISIFGIDDEYLYFANSWAPVNWEKLSSFKIRRDKFATLKRNSVVNRRYWIVYDKKDITTPPLFDDYHKDKDTEEYKAVKLMKDLWLIKGANGKLMPNEPLTREQMCLILYRFINILPGKINQPVESKPIEEKVEVKSVEVKPKSERTRKKSK